jgi:hypothetical protein
MRSLASKGQGGIQLLVRTWQVAQTKQLDSPSLSHSGSSYSPLTINDFIVSSSSSSKGKPPHRSVYRIIPKDQMSASVTGKQGRQFISFQATSTQLLAAVFAHLPPRTCVLATFPAKRTPSSRRTYPTACSLLTIPERTLGLPVSLRRIRSGTRSPASDPCGLCPSYVSSLRPLSTLQKSSWLLLPVIFPSQRGSRRVPRLCIIRRRARCAIR